MSQDARETESQKRIRNTQNKPCTVELVTRPNRDYRPSATSEHTFFYIISCITLRIHRWICPGKAKYRRILLNSIISRGEKWHRVGMDHCRSFKVEKAWFSNICNLTYVTIICSPCYNYWLIFFVMLVNERDFSRPAPTRFSLLLFMFLWMLFLAKYD